MSDAARFQRLEACFNELIDLDPAPRARRLDEILAEDPALHAELVPMLAESRIGEPEPLAEIGSLARALISLARTAEFESVFQQALGPLAGRLVIGCHSTG